MPANHRMTQVVKFIEEQGASGTTLQEVWKRFYDTRVESVSRLFEYMTTRAERNRDVFYREGNNRWYHASAAKYLPAGAPSRTYEFKPLNVACITPLVTRAGALDYRNYRSQYTA